MTTVLDAPTGDASVTELFDEIRTRLNKERLEADIDTFVDLISSDGFLSYVNDIAALPTFADRRRHTVETASLDTLRDLGVDTPAELRMTTREFEIPEDGVVSSTPLVQIRPGSDPRMGFCVSLGWFLCVSYGG